MRRSRRSRGSRHERDDRQRADERQDPRRPALRRKEDPRLITGRATYVDDINLTGQLWAAWVRSPEAHAKIVSIDTSAAKARDGIWAVYTNDDLDMEAGLPMAWVPPGITVNTPDHWVLAKGEVKHVGDPVALVSAATATRWSTPPRTLSSSRPAPGRRPIPSRRSSPVRRSCTSSSVRTRCATGRSAAAISRAGSPRPTSSSSGRSSTIASPAPRSSPARARRVPRRSADRVELHPGSALPAAVPRDPPRHGRGPGPRDRARGRGTSARSSRSTPRRSAARGHRGSSGVRSSGSRRAPRG